MRTSVFIAASLDGFIARPDGGIDWLGSPSGPEGEDYGYGAFIADVDAMIVGRKTYEKVLSFDAWPYGDMPVVVLSHRPLPRTESVTATVRSLSLPPHEVVRELESSGVNHAYVDGGETIQAFLRAGLIQRIILTRIPILIGSGIPLFGPIDRDIRLEHVATHSYPSGLVQSEYHVLADAG